MLDADRNADGCIVDADSSAHLERHARMRSCSGMAGQRLGSAQAHRKFENLQPVETAKGLLQTAFHVEGKGGPRRRALCLVDTSLWSLLRQERQIVHLRDLRVLVEKLRNKLRIAVAAL